MSDHKDGKWILSSGGKDVWNSDMSFETREEAIRYGVKLLSRYNFATNEEKEDIGVELSDNMEIDPVAYENFYSFELGQIEKARLSFNALSILENIADNAYDEYGEVAECYLTDVKDEHVEELEELINDWFVKHDYMPRFYKINNVETINLYNFEESK